MKEEQKNSDHTEFIWRNFKFNELGWYGNRLKRIAVPNEDFKLCLELDYIIERGENKNVSSIAPVMAIFYNVAEFKLSIEMGKYDSIDIISLKRTLNGTTPNGKLDEFFYDINFDCGSMSFLCTDFEQIDMTIDYRS